MNTLFAFEDQPDSLNVPIIMFDAFIGRAAVVGEIAIFARLAITAHQDVTLFTDKTHSLV